MKLMELYNEIQWIDEALLDEEYPTSWDAKAFAEITSYAGRVKYANDNLQKIKAGSGRVVYKIDNEKVLKLSKNKKGIAQTKVEIEWGQDNYLQSTGVIAKIFSYDPDGLWVEMELARKLTKSKFKSITGIDFDVFGGWLRYTQLANKGRAQYATKPTEEDSDFLWENEFTSQVMDVMLNYDMPAGDLARLSSYGIVGDDDIVIVDYGLSSDVYKLYKKD